MFSSCDDVFPVSRTEPASRIDLRESKLVGHPDFVKRAVAQNFMVADPAAVSIQCNPDTGEGCKCPACFSNLTRRLQLETVKPQFFCAEQSPHFQGEKRRHRGAT